MVCDMPGLVSRILGWHGGENSTTAQGSGMSSSHEAPSDPKMHWSDGTDRLNRFENENCLICILFVLGMTLNSSVVSWV